MGEGKKIEILFPEFCNLFGDISNYLYLKKCLPEATFIETSIDEEPRFVSEAIDLVYMGPMSESKQEKVIHKLLPYRDKLNELIDHNTLFLITGNAIEIFFDYIENEDHSKIEGLGLFNLYAKRDMFHRHNSIYVGDFEAIEIVGFRSQFTFAYGNNEDYYFSKVINGIGINPNSKFEGIKRNNFIATYLLGPILILNPLFTKNLLMKMGIEINEVAFEEDAMNAYELRLEEMKKLKDIHL